MDDDNLLRHVSSDAENREEEEKYERVQEQHSNEEAVHRAHGDDQFLAGVWKDLPEDLVNPDGVYDGAGLSDDGFLFGQDLSGFQTLIDIDFSQIDSELSAVKISDQHPEFSDSPATSNDHSTTNYEFGPLAYGAGESNARPSGHYGIEETGLSADGNAPPSVHDMIDLIQEEIDTSRDGGSEPEAPVSEHDVNEVSTDLSLNTDTVAENSADGTVVGTAFATDPDAGETFTYSLTDNAGGRFAIDSNTGEVTVADGSQFDFESDENHNVTIEVTESGGNTYSEVMEIDVTNVNEVSTDLSLNTDTVAENSANGTMVVTASATDPDAGETFTYSLTDNAGGRFAIDADTGEITVADGSQLDFESDENHNVTIEVTDSAGYTYSEVMEIEVTNVNEAMTDLSMTNNSRICPRQQSNSAGATTLFPFRIRLSGI